MQIHMDYKNKNICSNLFWLVEGGCVSGGAVFTDVQSWICGIPS